MIERATDAGFTAGVTRFIKVNPIATAPSQVTYRGQDRGEELAPTGTGCGPSAIRSATLLTPGFPTMSADSSPTQPPSSSGPRRPPAAPTDPDGSRASRTAGEPDLDGHRDQRNRLRGRALHRSELRPRPHQLRPDRYAGTENRHGYRDLRGYHGRSQQHLLVPGQGGERNRVVGVLEHAANVSVPRFRRRRPVSP